MPELPEVEILVRHLGPLLKNRTIRGVRVLRARVIAPTPESQFIRNLRGARFTALSRRGKYLLFTLQATTRRGPILLVGHLGMTGRMYLLPKRAPLPKHAAVVMELSRGRFVYEDPRYFGRLTLDSDRLLELGPEPLGLEFTADRLASALSRSTQPIKVKLLDQTLAAGVGNIYASEALFRAGISPRLAAGRLTRAQIERLWRAIRAVLSEAIDCGSTLPLDFAGERIGIVFSITAAAGSESEFYRERLRVYDRAGRPCVQCDTAIQRVVQAARSTFYCPRCQRHGARRFS